MMQANKNRKTEEEEESLIEQLVSKYLPYWPIFMMTLLLAVGGAYGYLHYYATPIYEAKAAILIKDEMKGNKESKMSESLDPISSTVIVENEIEILQSYTLMVNTVKALQLYAPVFEKGLFKNKSAYTSSPVIIEVPNPDSIKEFNDPDSIKKYNKIYFSWDDISQTVMLDNSYRYSINQLVNTPYGKLKFVPNPYFKKPDKPGKQLYFVLINPVNLVPNLEGILKVETSDKLSSFVNLSYRDEVPQRAENILDQLITFYRQSEINEKDSLAKNTLVFVNDRLSLVANDLDAIDKKVQQYKSGKGAVNISKQGELYLENVSANDQKLSEVNSQISELDQVEKFVKNNEFSGAIVPFSVSVGVPTSVLSQLIDKLYTSELEYEKLKKTVGENNNTLVSIQDQVNKIKTNILQNIQSQKQDLIAAKQNIYATNGSYNSILQTVPQKERQLLDISREQQIKSNIYGFLLQKKEESQLAYASAVSSNRVVDMAHTSPSPVSPNIIIVYLMAIVACLGVCAQSIAIREYLLGKVLYRHEVESRTSAPILGEIDFNKSKKPIVITGLGRSFVAEEFRKLETSLSFMGIDATHKKILVTSSISGEGKSFVAVNLAISIALTGKKVALVDMDLNNPSLSKILQVIPDYGFTDFLAGKKEPKEIITGVEEYKNLFFIPAGNIPENPSGLLTTENAKELIDYLENIYDRVIIDTSPVFLVNDGIVLAALCDATLYVVRHNYTPKTLIKRIDKDNLISTIKNLTIVFNGVKTRGFYKNYYGYGYNYKYGKKKIGKVRRLIV
jgi:capsular exopolysaccharide synthesis family protein